MVRDKKKCKVCGKKFTPTYSRHVICGASYCRHRNWHVPLFCQTCGKRFFPVFGKEREQKYCSVQCSAKAREREVLRVCPVCNKEFWSKPWRNQTNCSKKCTFKARGTGRYSRKIKTKGGLDHVWSWIIRTKAKGRCEICGATEKVLNAHHIISRKCASTRWYIPNGIAICVSCHRFGKEAAHENPLYFMEKLEKVKGKELLEHLKQKGRETFQWKKHVDEIREYLYHEKEKLI